MAIIKVLPPSLKVTLALAILLAAKYSHKSWPQKHGPLTAISTSSHHKGLYIATYHCPSLAISTLLML